MATKQEANGAMPPPHELENLVPEDEKSKEIIISKYCMTKDVESAGDFDPFAERKVDNPTSNMDTLTHLLKASLGTGILAMPYAFRAAGLITGMFFTILVAVVCTHCAYVLNKM